MSSQLVCGSLLPLCLNMTASPASNPHGTLSPRDTVHHQPVNVETLQVMLMPLPAAAASVCFSARMWCTGQDDRRDTMCAEANGGTPNSSRRPMHISCSVGAMRRWRLLPRAALLLVMLLIILIIMLLTMQS